MAGECDDYFDKDEMKPPDNAGKTSEDIRDDNLLEDILVNPHPKNKTYKADPLAQLLNVSLE